MSATKHTNKIDVNQADFQTEVIQRSFQLPVLVDFWAPWCGPCRMLGPVLERLAAEPNSNFLLAKVNSDLNPGLSMQYQVRGIPAVKAFVNGRVVDEFVGAQPEPMVRQFIKRVAANHQPQQRAEARRTSTPRPGNMDPAGRLNQARQLLCQGKGCEAQSLLENFPAGVESATVAKLRPLASFMCQASQGKLAAGAADLGVLYRQVADAVRRREYSTALYNLLAILRQDGQYQNGQAKAVMRGIFELLGDQDPLTRAYQEQAAILLD